MNELLPISAVCALAAVGQYLLVRNRPRVEARILHLSFIAHGSAALLQVWLLKSYFVVGDQNSYFEHGLRAASLLQSDFGRFFPELMLAIVRLDYHLPIPLWGTSTTQSFTAIAGVLLYLANGSLYAVVLGMSFGAYFAKVSLANALRPEFSPENFPYAFAGLLLSPSGVVWSGALLKEPLVVIALGPLLRGLLAITRRQKLLRSLVVISSAGFIIALLKPYILVVTAFAFGCYFVASRRRQVQRSTWSSAFAGAALIAMFVVGYQSTSHRDETAEARLDASAIAAQRRSGYEVSGGSSYLLEEEAPSPEASDERQFREELVLAPAAVATALFRPTLFEANNAVQFTSALETSIIILLLFQALWRNGAFASLRACVTNPPLVLCFAFTSAMAVVTGLTSSNLGSLSRYRAPMMPFYLALVLVLRYATTSRTAAPKSRMVSASGTEARAASRSGASSGVSSAAKDWAR